MSTMQPKVREAMKDAINALRCNKGGVGYPKSLADIIYFVRCAMDEAREELDAAPLQSASDAPASWDDIYSDLRVAASRRQGFGASDAQIRLIATLAVKQGLRLPQISVPTLTKAEASALIETLK